MFQIIINYKNNHVQMYNILKDCKLNISKLRKQEIILILNAVGVCKTDFTFFLL